MTVDLSGWTILELAIVYVILVIAGVVAILLYFSKIKIGGSESRPENEKSDLPKWEGQENFIQSIQQSIMQLDNKINEIVLALTPVKDKDKRSLLLVLQNIEKIIKKFDDNKRGQLVADDDQHLIIEELSKLTLQIDALNKILQKNAQSSDLTAKIFDSLDILPTILNLLQTLKSTENGKILNADDKDFIKQTLSDFSQVIERKIREKQKAELPLTELAQSFDAKGDDIIKRIKDLINAQGYKTCVNCGTAAVPKNAVFCPQCAGKEFVTISNLPS